MVARPSSTADFISAKCIGTASLLGDHVGTAEPPQAASIASSSGRHRRRKVKAEYHCTNHRVRGPMLLYRRA